MTSLQRQSEQHSLGDQTILADEVYMVDITFGVSTEQSPDEIREVISGALDLPELGIVVQPCIKLMRHDLQPDDSVLYTEIRG